MLFLPNLETVIVEKHLPKPNITYKYVRANHAARGEARQQIFCARGLPPPPICNQLQRPTENRWDESPEECSTHLELFNRHRRG